METWYRVHKYGPRISAVKNVIGETATFVKIAESETSTRYERKITTHDQLFPTFLEARAAAIEAEQRKIDECLEQIKKTQELITRLSIADAKSIEVQQERYR